MVLAYHTKKEWAAVRAAQLRRLGCSNEYVRKIIAEVLDDGS